MIITRGLNRTFGSVLAVDDLNLEIADGEVFGLIGPNGAGKTTTMRMLTCLIEPTSGTATLDNYEITKERHKMRIRQIVGLLPEYPGLYETLSAHQNLAFFADLQEMDPDIKEMSTMSAAEAQEFSEFLQASLDPPRHLPTVLRAGDPCKLPRRERADDQSQAGQSVVHVLQPPIRGPAEEGAVCHVLPLERVHQLVGHREA